MTVCFCLALGKRVHERDSDLMHSQLDLSGSPFLVGQFFANVTVFVLLCFVSFCFVVVAAIVAKSFKLKAAVIKALD